jgi:hypothetical protein
MADIVIDFHKGPPKIGLIVRGKQGPDIIRTSSRSMPILLWRTALRRFLRRGHDGSLNALGLGMQGVVHISALRLHRA